MSQWLPEGVTEATPIRVEQVFAFINRGEDWRKHTQKIVDSPVYEREFGDKLRNFRIRERGISQREAAQCVGLPLAVYSGIEFGRYIASPKLQAEILAGIAGYQP